MKKLSIISTFLIRSKAMSSRCTSLHGVAALLLLPLAAPQNIGDTGPNTQADYPHFSPSLAVTMTGIVLALFFMVFLFALYVRYCDSGAISGSVRAITGGMSRRPAPRGLDKSVIETFPTFAYSAVKELKIGKGALECAVCICEFDDDETLRLIPNCDHVFHPDCIDLWLASHTTCPVCRADLSAADSDSDTAAQEDNQNVEIQVQIPPLEHVVMSANETLNRNRTRGSRSGLPRKFPRSHSTGHSYPVQPADDRERFTLRLPAEVRRQIMKNRQLHRWNSMVALPTEGSSRRGYRTSWEGSGGGRKSYRRLDSLGQVVKSDRWVFSITPPFLMRALSQKVAEGNSGTAPILKEDCGDGASGSSWQRSQSPV